MTTHIKTYPVGRATLLDAFAKLFAQKPSIYVFRRLEGWQFATAEMPETYQVLVGMSEELYHAVRNRLFRETRTRLEDRAEVQWVNDGSSVTIHSAPRVVDVVDPDAPPDFTQLPSVELRPKPLAGT
jgi:hypothetical protein